MKYILSLVFGLWASVAFSATDVLTTPIFQYDKTSGSVSIFDAGNTYVPIGEIGTNHTWSLTGVGGTIGSLTVAPLSPAVTTPGSIALHITPPTGLGLAFDINQTLHGTVASTLTGNYISFVDDATVTGAGFGGSGAQLWNMQHFMGGLSPSTTPSLLEGGRTTLSLASFFQSPDDGVSTTPNFVTLGMAMDVNASDGGTNTNFTGGARAGFFAFNPALIANNSLNTQALTTAEFDGSCSTTCSTAYFFPLSVVELATSRTQGAQVDAGIVISAESGAIGFKNPILIGPSNSGYPYNPSSTIIAMSGQSNALHGVDFSGVWDGSNNLTGIQFSGCAFKFKKFCVDNNANTTVNNLNVATVTVSSSIITPGLVASSFINLPATYTVGTLPACNSAANGTLLMVTDAASPTYNTTVTGGGIVHVPVVCNTTNWTSH